MASNRKKKLKLFEKDPHCHWCGRLTVLTNDKEIKGQPNPLMATVDHLYSRYNPMRWVKAMEGEKRQVLTCFECNQRRAAEETNALPPHIVVKMSQGFSLIPHSNPLFNRGQESLDAVLNRMKENDIEVFSFDKPVNFKPAKVLAKFSLDEIPEVV